MLRTRGGGASADDDDEPKFRGPVNMEKLLDNPPKPPMSCPKGTSLWLLQNNLDDRCMEYFSFVLSRGDYRHMTYLGLGNNYLSWMGISAVAHAISQDALPQLTYFGMQENENVGDQGMIALSAALVHIPKLSTLDVQKCKIGASGWAAFNAAAIKKDAAVRSLTALYASTNEIGDDGVKGLCEAFAAGSFPNLEHIHIRESKIGDEGCLSIANAIEDGYLDKLRQIQFSGNIQTRDGQEVVTEVIKEYEKKTLNFWY